VPRIQAQALRDAGVAGAAISIIPDEQEAIDAALRMGEAGDLLLIFADALARSWKQITKFKSSGTPARAETPGARSNVNGSNTGTHHYSSAAAAEPVPDITLEGVLRDERGIRMAPASDD
jgi:cyanophycin synthetase